MVMVLVVMFVLMILGTSMLSLALSSYKFRAIEQNKKVSMYASEAGIDEAYGIMGTFVQYGIQQGNKAVDEYDKNFETMIKVERYKVERTKESDYIDKGGVIKRSTYIDKDGVITNSTVEADKKRVFEEGYKESNIQSLSINYMEEDAIVPVNCYDSTGSITEKGYKEFIETGLISGEGIFKQEDILSHGGMGNLIDKLNGYTNQINVASDDKEDIKVNDEKTTKFFDGNNKVVVNIESSYTHNSTPRIINATYEINIAKYNVQYNLLPTQIVKIPKNPAWSKALMVNGDMKINEGSVIIGKESEDSDLDSNNTGIYVSGKETGIDLQNNTASLKVIGNVVTNKNLMLSYDAINTTTNNNVEVNGNIYARNIIIAKKTTTDEQSDDTSELEAIGGEIHTVGIDAIRDGSVYLMDDLEINRGISTVDIAGSYYGVSDGSEGERNNSDNSSAIIINTEDIGNKKEVDKDGNIFIDPISYESNLTIGKNLYIAGTSYIKLADDKKYQTGESISIVGNYRAYTEPLTNPTNPQFKKDSVIFEYIDPLTLVTKYNKVESDASRTVKALLEENRYVTVNLTDIGNADEMCKDTYSYNVIYNNNEQSKIVPIGKTVKLDTSIKKSEVTVKLYKLGNILIKDEQNVTLISSVKMNAFDKSKYFQQYVNQPSQENGLNLGEGITINTNSENKPENINAGSISSSKNSGDSISSDNWNIGLDMKIKARSIQLKNQLFYMGQAEEYTELATETEIDKISDASDVKVMTDSNYRGIDDKTEPEVTMANNIDFTKLTTRNEVNNNEVIILDKDQNSTYVLKGKNAGTIPGNATVVDLTSENEYKG
ncbi:hypothetical protein, partial [Clostridium sp.]|uniref:hypothetical protein n=1 Tax=Clostridium sp. TaxID=1506 RepID=UPI003F4C6F5B